MAELETFYYHYDGKAYPSVKIPNVFSVEGTDWLIIGCQSLNKVLYNDEIGYANEEAKRIDEEIYAYIDDEYFELGTETFIKNVIILLD